jgi:hypothetical protein
VAVAVGVGVQVPARSRGEKPYLAAKLNSDTAS